MIDYSQPPFPQNTAALKRIYPWDEYDINMVMQWLYGQARKTGFSGTIDDFKLRYGSYVEAQDPQDIHDLIENYTGTYHITPLVSIEQVLKTKNKIMNQDIIIDPIPEELVTNYAIYRGRYEVTPLPGTAQVLRTKDKALEDNIIVEKIPYAEVSNTAGGITCIIG